MSFLWCCLAMLVLGGLASAQAQETTPLEPEIRVPQVVEPKPNIDQRINDAFAPALDAVNKVVFFRIYESEEKNAEGKPRLSVPFILIWLGGAAVILTIYFRFINLSGFALALRTVRGKYSSPNDPGEISHFQALTSAVSGTVGLGNIAGVAIAIQQGGPGAALWMILLGLFGMTSKFAECTLGVKYREIDAAGKVHGGPMFYLRKGLAERGLGKLGTVLAVLFAILCVGGSFGGGNMFQVNQAVSQLVNVTGGQGSFIDANRWIPGLIIAGLVGMVIIGGICRIGKVTCKLVPVMAILYVAGCLVVLWTHASSIGATLTLIWESAFNASAVGGGIIGVMLIGIQRAAFSNEAGVGSAPIAHAAAKTHYPAGEGVVALLEPFIDTVMICTMTALVVIITGDYIDTGVDGITMTSDSFASVMPWFTYLLSAAVILFALSTLITWSYYGLQAWKYLFGKSMVADLTYKVLFCLVVVVGAAMAPGNVIEFSDAVLLGMCFPNLIGVFLLLPVVKRELVKFRAHAREVDHSQGKV